MSPSIRTNSPRLWALVGLTGVASIAAVLLLPAAGLDRATGTMLLLAGLASLAGACPVRIAKLRAQMSAMETFVLCSLVVLGPRPAVLVAFAGVMGTMVRRRQQPIRVVFNLAVLALSTSVAWWSFSALGGQVGPLSTALLWPLTAATAVYFSVNTGLVAGIIALEEQRDWFSAWRRSCAWTAGAFFTSLSLTVGVLLALEAFGPWALLLSIPPCWLISSTYGHYRARFEEQQRRIEQVEGLNGELQRTVSDLNDALHHVEQLQGLLPICMHCKSIRDDQDTWHRIEEYLARRGQIQFTHGLCGSCRDEHYPAPTPV